MNQRRHYNKKILNHNSATHLDLENEIYNLLADKPDCLLDTQYFATKLNCKISIVNNTLAHLVNKKDIVRLKNNEGDFYIKPEKVRNFFEKK